MRILTAGESHGRCLVGILEGMPAGLEIREEEIVADLQRRQQGYGRGERMRIENDRAQILSGVRHGITLGSPIALMIENRDWENWRSQMRIEAPPESESFSILATPRPGHADLTGAMKYHHRDMRNVIERASARETAMRVALAAVCRKFLHEFGIHVGSHVVKIGGVAAENEQAANPEEINRLADASPVRCLDKKAEREMMQAIDLAKNKGDTVGGTFKVIASGLPAGLGSYVHFDRRLDALLAQAMMSIPAVKSMGFGLAEEYADRLGSEVHDVLVPDGAGFAKRAGNHAGGIEGGMSTGEPIVMRIVMKPLATLGKPLPSMNMAAGQTAEAHAERSDVCAVPAAAIVGEAMCLLTLINPFLEKFGGDSMSEINGHLKEQPGSPWA
ncbi:chorismate synthase [candidate division KSB1 bacterium]|nr:MAG: chorismate synthase [candidate division KSB1 bacterium]